jgi:hypothetical protein
MLWSFLCGQDWRNTPPSGWFRQLGNAGRDSAWAAERGPDHLWPALTVAYNETVAVVIDQAAGASGSNLTLGALD